MANPFRAVPSHTGLLTDILSELRALRTDVALLRAAVAPPVPTLQFAVSGAADGAPLTELTNEQFAALRAQVAATYGPEQYRG